MSATLLDRWFAALAASGDRAATLTILGDSITAGASAKGGGRRPGLERVQRGRFADRVGRALAQRYNAVAHEDGWTGAGWFEVESTRTSLRFGWDHVSGFSAPCGLGGYGRLLGPGDELRHRAQCDAVDLFHTWAPEGGAYIVQIDGEVMASVDTCGSETESGHRWSSGPIDLAWHEICVRCPAEGSPVLIDGGYFHRGTSTAGVRVHVGGHNGWDTADLMDDRGTADHVRLNPPDLVIWFTGTNDYAGGADRYRTNLEEAMNRLHRLCPDADRLIAIPFAITNRGAWPTFQTAALDVAAALDVPYVDLFALAGNALTTQSPLVADDRHPSDDGHRFIADAILERIAPPPFT